MKNIIRFDEFLNEGRMKREEQTRKNFENNKKICDKQKENDKKSKLEDELDKELAWVRKYDKYVEKGTYPKNDYNDADEFYDDLEKTENNIERLNKLLRK